MANIKINTWGEGPLSYDFHLRQNDNNTVTLVGVEAGGDVTNVLTIDPEHGVIFHDCGNVIGMPTQFRCGRQDLLEYLFIAHTFDPMVH